MQSRTKSGSLGAGPAARSVQRLTAGQLELLTAEEANNVVPPDPDS